MKTRLAVLFVAGVLTEIIWVVSVLSLKHDRWILAGAVAVLAPYIQLITAAISIVDEPSWYRRFLYTTAYAIGDLVGFFVALITWPPG